MNVGPFALKAFFDALGILKGSSHDPSSYTRTKVSYIYADTFAISRNNDLLIKGFFEFSVSKD